MMEKNQNNIENDMKGTALCPNSDGSRKFQPDRLATE
jgi:hypothetical protein